VIGGTGRDAVDQAETVRGRLDDLAAAIGRLRVSDEARADLADRLAAVRATLEQERLAGLEELHRLGHDLRAPLNAIAGWTHILRLDSTTAGTVQRAAEVFDRSVRALTRLIETYADGGARR